MASGHQFHSPNADETLLLEDLQLLHDPHLRVYHYDCTKT